MKNRILFLCFVMATLFACSSDQISNDDVNLKSQNQSFSKKAVDRPFKITKGAGSFVTFPGDGITCSALSTYASFEGNATHLGHYTSLEEWCWNGLPNDLGTRFVTYTASNGDKLYASPIEIIWKSATTFDEIVTITGGTGRFNNATGEFTQSVLLTYGDDTLSFGTFIISASGTINY